MKLVKIISWFLGCAMFMFGVLKFINPFKSWYTTQVYNSGIPTMAYWAGITGEIITGLCLIPAMLFINKLSVANFKILTSMASCIIIVMMLTSCYVHFHPAVPADVLPLKIKPPVIPIVFMLLAAINLYTTIKTPTSRINSLSV